VPRDLSKAQKDKLREFDSVTNEKNYKKKKSFSEKIKGFFNE